MLSLGFECDLVITQLGDCKTHGDNSSDAVDEMEAAVAKGFIIL
jgi:hypothetical protein